MKCPICNGKGTQFIADYDGMYDIVCYKCKGKGELDENGNPILNNEEWFATLSTEEKADLLFGTFYLAGRNDEKIGDWKGVDTIVEWLKQPHTKGDSE